MLTFVLLKFQFENVVSFDIQSVVDEHFMQSLSERLGEVGKVRFTKCINEMIWVAFQDHGKAIEAEKLGSIQVRIVLQTALWWQIVAKYSYYIITHISKWL